MTDGAFGNMVTTEEGASMRSRASMGEVWIGLLVLSALAGLLGLVGMASDGPGFLASQKTIDVVFRDGQGIRVGSPVRIAGLDAGNVVDLSLVEVEGCCEQGCGCRCLRDCSKSSSKM